MEKRLVDVVGAGTTGVPLNRAQALPHRTIILIDSAAEKAFVLSSTRMW